MNRFLAFNVLLAYLTLAPPCSWGDPPLIAEPPQAMQMSWNLANNGMLFIGYDTNGNGKLDFHTLRVVRTSYFSKHSLDTIKGHHPEHLIFASNFSTSNYYYIALKQPLFYAMDLDEDGLWDIIYKDPLQDGVNGNEAFYDSPSGMRQAPSTGEEVALSIKKDGNR
jgi:hypothetical protein